MMNHRQWFDQAAAEWDTMEWEETHVRLRETVAGLGIEPGAAVLDVGCGTGVLLPLLHESMSGNGYVVALDLSEEMLKRALSKGQPVFYVQGDAQRLPLRSRTFDWVICNAVFPHFPNKSRALREIHHVLKAGGRLVICHANSREAINEIHRSIGGVIAHDTIPDKIEMLRLLREARLVKAQVRDAVDHYLALAQRDSRP